VPNDSDPLRDLFGEPIFRYTAEDAVRDGVFVHTGWVGRNREIPVYLTSNLVAAGYEDPERQRRLVLDGLEQLRSPDPEDSDYMRLRVLEDGKVWVTLTGEGVTYMLPSDW
jgi:hypothetical protein